MVVFGLVKGLHDFKRIIGIWVHDLIQLAKYFLCGFLCISATKEPLQTYNLISGFQSPF